MFSDVSLGSGEYGEGEARKGERIGRREKKGGREEGIWMGGGFGRWMVGKGRTFAVWSRMQTNGEEEEVGPLRLRVLGEPDVGDKCWLFRPPKRQERLSL